MSEQNDSDAAEAVNNVLLIGGPYDFHTIPMDDRIIDRGWLVLDKLDPVRPFYLGTSTDPPKFKSFQYNIKSLRLGTASVMVGIVGMTDAEALNRILTLASRTRAAEKGE